MKGNKIFDFSRAGFQDIINIMTRKINECVDISNGMIARVDDYISKVDWNKIINSDLYQKVLDDLGKTNEQLDNKANKSEVGSPLIASNISEMVDKTKVYVNTTDGNWYSWNGATWEIGGVYNSQAIGKDSVKIDMIETKLKDTLGTYIFGALGKNLNLSKAWSSGTGTYNVSVSENSKIVELTATTDYTYQTRLTDTNYNHQATYTSIINYEVIEVSGTISFISGMDLTIGTHTFIGNNNMNSLFNVNISSGGHIKIKFNYINSINFSIDDAELKEKFIIDSGYVTSDIAFIKPILLTKYFENNSIPKSALKDEFLEEISAIKENLGEKIYLTKNINRNKEITDITTSSTNTEIVEDGKVFEITSGFKVYEIGELLENWISDNRYLLAIEVETIEGIDNLGSITFQPSKNNWQASVPLSKNLVVLDKFNKTNSYVLACTIDSALNDSSYNSFFLQIDPTFLTGASTGKIKIKNIATWNLTKLKLSDDEAFNRFKNYGYTDIIASTTIAYNSLNSVNSINSEYSKYTNNYIPNDTIQLWGDSLVAQGYGDIIGQLLNRNVQSFGYGGKTSTYIRDKFLSLADFSKPQIIIVGRNNKSEPYRIVDDIRAMVEKIPHNNFIIGCPPNGIWGENLTTSGNAEFIKIEKLLQNQYQSNFLNTRLASIYEYDMGNIKLTSSFVQPNIGEQVTINVSNSAFLMIRNSNETSGCEWSNGVNDIILTFDMDKYDRYEIISADTTNNTITIKLKEKNLFNVGETVDNKTYGDGEKSYLRVLQYADYWCFMNETTQSTFRNDGIHMSIYGRKCLAKVIARKVSTMKI